MKVLTSDSLSHLVTKLKELIPGLVNKNKPGLVPELPEDTNQVLRSDGTWGSYTGDMNLKVEDDGHLYLYYDDGTPEE